MRVSMIPLHIKYELSRLLNQTTSNTYLVLNKTAVRAYDAALVCGVHSELDQFRTNCNVSSASTFCFLDDNNTIIIE